MRNFVIQPGSLLRNFFPLIRKLRFLAWKFNDRVGVRLVISGGKARFLDADLEFPEGVGLQYTTPLFWNGPNAYEGSTSRTLAFLAGHARVFLDIGSNIGIYAVYVGVKFPQVKIYAFEPIPVICEKNRAFHRANKLSDSVTQNLALSDRDGTQDMILPVYATGLEEEQTATLNTGSWQIQEKDVKIFQVKCLTLDTFAAANALPVGPVVLKIDVENFEAPVLRGGKKFISERRPWILCEILPNQEIDAATGHRRNNNRETTGVITELGYEIFAVTDAGLFRMNPVDFTRARSMKDFLLVPKERVPGDILYFALEDMGKVFSL